MVWHEAVRNDVSMRRKMPPDFVLKVMIVGGFKENLLLIVSPTVKIIESIG